MKFNASIPTKVVFGSGRIAELHEQKLPGTHALLVISSGKSVRMNGTLGKVRAQLDEAGVQVSVFDRVGANPTKFQVMEGARVARGERCDFVVALGGGSVIDAAKAIALMAANVGDYWDYIASGTGKGQTPAERPLPIVAIPTTAGTGSEVDGACVITNEDTFEKTGFGMPEMFPVLAIVDPELTLTVPPRFTAYQGFDALFHSVECYVSNKANPVSDMIALTAVRAISGNLPRAVHGGGDLAAREQVALGSNLSGAVMTISGCTSEHSLEHAVSAYHGNLPHGAGLIMISTAYFSEFIRCHACDQRFVDLARAMGDVGASAPEDFVAALEELIVICDVADLRMSDFGIASDEFGKIVANARTTMGRLFRNDPVRLDDDACERILEESYR